MIEKVSFESKMRMKLLIVCCLLTFTTADEGDESFKKMCEFWSGAQKSYRERLSSKAMEGDKCSMVFPVVSANEGEARRYCEENVPFHILNVKIDKSTTTCDAEATLKCEQGWVQMFGRCYKIEKKMMKRDSAVEYCATLKPKARIAFMHREALPFRINDYFSKVSRVWIDASEAITNDLTYVKGENLLLALDGYKYALPNIALAKVPSDETAMALCEYTPTMNQAESNYLLRRYGEIYHTILFTPDRAYVRTASSLQRSDNRKRDSNYCKKVLRPFLHNDDIAQSADPNTDFLELLSKDRDATIIRTSVYSRDASLNNRKNAECTDSRAKNYGYDNTDGEKGLIFTKVPPDVWAKNQPEEKCDAGSWSTGIVFSRKGERRLETMSDARYAPIYCQTNFEKVTFGDCPSGYTEYWRAERRQKWCHKFINRKANFDDANAYCNTTEKGFVTGFADAKELELLDQLLDKAIKSGTVFKKSEGVYLGVQRRHQCINRKQIAHSTGGFNPDPTHPCSKERLFEWVYGVADHPPLFKDYWAVESEPNFVGDDERCVELVKGFQTRSGWPTGEMSKKLNDLPCDKQLYFFCGKEAPIKVIGVNV
ncbi:hypothetical protein L3Y34_017214 [Caenorhabditis briggsae]|uniref:C-type lectin domain-containing protein n=2 Tax=Caenorhabditis briggsae TaxID=6238 RepID=A0AAE9DGW1_CAEBR|nr:hypothetical protein L3Y34_017214 [Caenorhabditis briggsae]